MILGFYFFETLQAISSFLPLNNNGQFLKYEINCCGSNLSSVWPKRLKFLCCISEKNFKAIIEWNFKNILHQEFLIFIQFHRWFNTYSIPTLITNTCGYTYILRDHKGRHHQAKKLLIFHRNGSFTLLFMPMNFLKKNYGVKIHVEP